MYANSLTHRSGAETPVVVCIDEIQNIEQDSPANALVRHLHTQDVAPVLLVCAGLANALERLPRNRHFKIFRPKPLCARRIGLRKKQ